jgi:hypothetical protein
VSITHQISVDDAFLGPTWSARILSLMERRRRRRADSEAGQQNFEWRPSRRSRLLNTVATAVKESLCRVRATTSS